ncbi:UNVERIFIED_CONTAM: hypothetical protein GTU68_023455, partial [Idotea baltica]|nr:hypothetical protein [Idotea baltica]
MEVPDVSNMSIGAADNDDEDNEDLEAELLALTGGKPSQGKKKARKVGPSSENLDKMVAACMDDNYEVDSDVEEPDLMAELSALVQDGDDDDESSTPPSDPISDTSPSTPVSAPALPTPVSTPALPTPVILRPSPLMAGPSVLALLKERIQMYEEAEANALAGGEAARAKRFSRGLKTLKQMQREVNSGKSIHEEDIPPQVLTSSSRSNSTRDLSGAQGDPAPTPTPATSIPQTIAFGQSGGDNSSVAGDVNPAPPPALATLKRRQHDYKMAALSAKHGGDKESA